jgi:hypothetical protein
MPVDQKDMQIMLTRDVMIRECIRLSKLQCRRSFRSVIRARTTCTAWVKLRLPEAIIWKTLLQISEIIPLWKNNNINLNELNIPVNSYGQFSCYELLQRNHGSAAS